MKVDCHQHFWRMDRGDYDWLSKDLAPLYRDFLPQDLEGLLADADVAKTVLVQAAATFAESEFMLSLADEHHSVAGVVGWIDMESPEALEQLDQLAAHPAFVGIRPMIQDIPDVDWMLREELSPIYEALIGRDLCFDALVKPPHLANLQALLARHPELKVVIDHGAKPDIASGDFDTWAEHMQALAADTNAYCKLSGLLTEAAEGAGAAELKPYVDHLLKHFGPARLMWGSDWPVLNLASSYEDWLAITEILLGDLSSADRDMILGDTAVRFYGLQDKTMGNIDKRLVLLDESDNILVACQELDAGTKVLIDGEQVVVVSALGMGHKLARHGINAGDKILRYGLPIGSALEDIAAGNHVHTHNMKSDYIASHYRDAVEGEL